MASGAAIGSRLAAELYGGQVLREAIEDDPQNFTRFLLLARDEMPPGRASKTSIDVRARTACRASLHRALGAFASRGVDLAKIESRPLRGRPWEYAFYLDAMGDPAGPAGEAVAELKEMAVSLRVLGSYPAAAAREDVVKLRSEVVTQGPERAPARAMLRAVGFGDGDFRKPVVGVASAYSTITPCNLGLGRLAARAEASLRAAGAMPQLFGTITVSDGISMGTPGHALLAGLARGDRGLDRDGRERRRAWTACSRSAAATRTCRAP